MNEREIVALANQTAKEIRQSITEGGRVLDDSGEDIIREFLRASLRMWQHGKKVTPESMASLITEIIQRRRHETQTETEVMNAMVIFGAKFPAFVENDQRERDAEAKLIAATMPAVKA